MPPSCLLVVLFFLLQACTAESWFQLKQRHQQRRPSSSSKHHGRQRSIFGRMWQIRPGGSFADTAAEESSASSDVMEQQETAPSVSEAPSDDCDEQTRENNHDDGPQHAREHELEGRREHEKVRRISAMIDDLRKRSGVASNDDSLQLRSLIASRRAEFMNDLDDIVSSKDGGKLPHPKRLLHFLAPKIPAIKHSPDVNLRIRSAKSNIDCGVAACIISTLAQACERYDQASLRQPSTAGKGGGASSSAPDVTTDRRFEQLVECILSGVNVRKRKREWLSQTLKNENIGGEDRDAADDDDEYDEIQDEANAEESEGLNVRDCCRAAWGLAILGTIHLQKLGGETTVDLFIALSLRVRELLLARVNQLRTGDLFDDITDNDNDEMESPEDRLHSLAEELAEDAATAMWTFACVKACTGLRSASLFQACSSILCQDIVEARRKSQNAAISTVIGGSDVVDRLAQSEQHVGGDDDAEDRGDSHETTHPSSPPSIATKDALIDWLSANEVNDVIWALALHGGDLYSTDETILSESSTALCETLFDRMMEWLEQDTKEAKLASRHSENTLATVEVVDAAAMLQLQSQSQAESSDDVAHHHQYHVGTENMTIDARQILTEPQMQEVQVVDAKKLLEAAVDGQTVAVERETVIADAGPGVIDSFNMANTESSTSSSSNSHPNHVLPTETVPRFSSSDLSAIAWAATELRDPLCKQIVRAVMEGLLARGSSSVQSLKGGDLANLAWALAKYADDLDHANEDVLDLMQLIVDASLDLLNEAQDSDDPSSTVGLLSVFQPPELGRLVWSLASALSTHTSIPAGKRNQSSIRKLLQYAIIDCAKSLPLFATEDLLRIAWAFLELNDGSIAMIGPQEIRSLGIVLSTAEDCLDRWERGLNRGPRKGSSNERHVGRDASRFSSFFGRPVTVNMPVLDERFGDTTADVERGDGNEEDSMKLSGERGTLPLLRHLSIDPSTLCKAACAFSRLAAHNSHITTNHCLTRVAVRLLSSKNGRLLKECTIHDIVRICEAVALSYESSHERDVSIGLFSRKIVQSLNSHLNLMSDDNMKALFGFDSATPAQLATLLWSLGQLGVKHRVQIDEIDSAYRRLHLIAPKRLLTMDQIASLDIDQLVLLLTGVTTMDSIHVDTTLVLNTLQVVTEKLFQIRHPEKLCEVLEAVSAIKEWLRKSPQSAQPSGPHVESNNKATAKNTTKTKSDNSYSEDEESSSSENSGSSADTNGQTHAVEDTERTDRDDFESLGVLCDGLLDALGTKFVSMIPRLRLQQIRRILRVYCLFPWKADELIDRIEAETGKRAQILLAQGNFADLRRLFTDVSNLSKKMKETVSASDDADESTTFEVLKRGVKSLFWPSEDVATDDASEDNGMGDDQMELSEEMLGLVSKSSQVSMKASSFVNDLEVIDPGCIRDNIWHAQQAAAMDIGQCLEFIAIYRRVEFETGTRRSRYDVERRRDIAKRVLSRLFP